MFFKYQRVVLIVGTSNTARLLLVTPVWGKLHSMDDRIDALLADVEAMHTSQETHARRGELGDEVAAHAAQRTLIERLRGAIGQPVQVVAGAREISGTAAFLGAGIFVVSGIETAIIATGCIREIRTRSRGHKYASGPLERLGIGSALRRLAAGHEEISLELASAGGVIRGRSDMVAADYVEISGRIIAHSAIAIVQARVNPFASELSSSQYS